MNDLRLALRNAVDSPPADVFDIDDIVRHGRRRIRRHRIKVAGVAAAVVALAAAGVSVVPRLADHASPPATHWKHLQDDGSVPADEVGVWVDSLPSGPAAHVAWADGDVLHVDSKTVRITGRGISASSLISVRAATSNGWFASVGTRRFGVIHPDGTYVDFQTHGYTATLLVSPDETQTLVATDSGGDVIDTATGRVITRAPAFRSAVAWTDEGIYAKVGEGPGRLVLWKPGAGITRPSFDETHCLLPDQVPGLYLDEDVLEASLQAGYSRCPIPALASVSPDGSRALAGSDVVDVATRRTITFAPVDPFVTGYDVGPYSRDDRSHAVLWEDNTHVLIEVETPTIAVAAGASTVQPQGSTYDIVRCNVLDGSCERASDPLRASGPGLAPLH